MSHISSPHNPRVKSAIKLRNRRERLQRKRFLIDGTRELRQALVGGVRLVDIFLCPALCGAEERELMERLQPSAAETHEVSESVWEKLAYGHQRNGIMAVAATPQHALATLPSGAHSLVVVLQGLEKPGNVGAIIRTADGAGANAVIVADEISDLYNPNTIRASLGTLFRLPVVTGRSSDVLPWLTQQGLDIYVTLVGAAANYTQVDLTRPCAIVVGSESQGVSADWRTAAVRPIAIPMLGYADSLNVSTSAAVVLYEAARQRSA